MVPRDVAKNSFRNQIIHLDAVRLVVFVSSFLCLGRVHHARVRPFLGEAVVQRRAQRVHERRLPHRAMRRRTPPHDRSHRRVHDLTNVPELHVRQIS